MIYYEDKLKEVKLAYIGGGSRGWAWGLMGDLALTERMSGTVALYDIDRKAAEDNAIIGNKYNEVEGCKSVWKYEVADSLRVALTGADAVIISILPGTFDEMESDVHLPEKYGIYQSVGDTVGAGGVIRALRTIPMFEEIALAIKQYCPNAWVINYTNPMTMCVRTLYKVFPEIKAFGCCHEVFGTQNFLCDVLAEINGIQGLKRSQLKCEVTGVNHFTWLTSVRYQDIDVVESYRAFCKKYADTGYWNHPDSNWMNSSFNSCQMVKMDLFNRFGIIAAAGDRHLAEFCPRDWYLKDPAQVEKWKYGLTTVAWRREDLKRRLQKSADLISGKMSIEIKPSGEEGVKQLEALFGLHEFTTNMNIPNFGQIPNLPLGAVVETNAVLRAGSLKPVFAGDIPSVIYPLIAPIVEEQELAVEAGLERDLDKAFKAFAMDRQITLPKAQAKALFDAMVDNTKAYLQDYFR